MTVKKTIVKAGTRYKVGLNGAADLNHKYQIVLAAPLDVDEIPTSFPGVPAIGSSHPNRSGFYVLGYDVSQPEGAAKNTLDIVVHYGPTDITVTPGEEGGDDTVDAVTEWGWDDSTGEKDLLSSVAVGNDAAKPVLNSAGDAFNAAPTVYIPTPVFTKVVRCSERKPYAQYLCTVNDRQLVIGAMTCAPATLLCTVAEKKLIGEWRLPYEYTIHLRYRSNIVQNTYPPVDADEMGWDAACVDTGMRYLDDTETPPKLKLIQVLSPETGQLAEITSPALLDGHGKQAQTDSDGKAIPVVLPFHAYRRTEFPEWFYSEPATPAPPEDME